MRKIAALVAAASLFTSSAFAAEATKGPLAAGKPAGTQEAALQTGGVLLVLGLVGAAGLIALIASQTQGSSSTGTKK